jgi:sugar phosphate isomerase/epimerase
MDYTVQGDDTPRMDELAAVYIKIRDERARLKQDFEANDVELEAQQNLIGEKMLDLCKELGADSIRTPAGTVIRSVKSRYWTNDWDSMYTFIEETGAFGLLEKRIHQSNMKDFLSENPDIYPKGLNVESQYTVTVRRAKEK